MMRRLLSRFAPPRSLAVLAAVVALLAGAGAALASPAATVPPSVPYPACFGKVPLLHAKIAGHIAYECLAVGVTPIQGVGVYWSDNLYALEYNWHPGHGEIVVDEIFLKSCHQVQLERHGAPCGLYGGVPLPDTTAGQDSYANGRLIWMADGCVVAAPTDTGAAPTTCAAVMTGGGASWLPGRPMNAVELLSAKGYWSIMNRVTPDQYW